MDRLQKYNQKLLATLGTLVLIGCTVLFVIGIGALLTDIVRKNNNSEIRDNSLTLSQQAQLNSDGISAVNQEATFNKPKLIDTLNGIYLIPISQVNLENKKNGNYQEPILASGSGRGFGKRTFYDYTGEYNNILIYNQKKGTKEFIFDYKIYITNFKNRFIGTKHYLFITGSVHDSNNDSKLNEDDLSGFFVYNFETNQLRDFNIQGFELVDYSIEYNTENLFIRYAKDNNKNGEINYLQEPIVLKALNLETWELVDFISNEKIEELTKMIN